MRARGSVALSLFVIAGCSAGPQDAYDALARRFAEGTLESRTEARNELIERGGSQAVAIFAAHLGDAAEATRLLALEGVSSLTEGHPWALDLLFPLLKDPSPELRLRTLHLLAFDEDPRIIPRLFDCVPDQDARIRKAAIESLGRRSVLEARPVFAAALQDPDSNVRETAERCLAQVDWLVRAREIRYHRPASTPYGKGTKQEAEYLKAHHAAWNFGIAGISEASIEAATLSRSASSACEAIPSVTQGWYAGSRDVSGFLEGVQKRLVSDAGARAQLKAHRRDVIAHPIEGWHIADE